MIRLEVVEAERESDSASAHPRRHRGVVNMKHRQRHAFTLIELVASAVLTAILMVTLMGVVWSAVRESSQLAQSQEWR